MCVHAATVMNMLYSTDNPHPYTANATVNCTCSVLTCESRISSATLSSNPSSPVRKSWNSRGSVSTHVRGTEAIGEGEGKEREGLVPTGHVGIAVFFLVTNSNQLSIATTKPKQQAL